MIGGFDIVSFHFGKLSKGVREGMTRMDSLYDIVILACSLTSKGGRDDDGVVVVGDGVTISVADGRGGGANIVDIWILLTSRRFRR